MVDGKPKRRAKHRLACTREKRSRQTILIYFRPQQAPHSVADGHLQKTNLCVSRYNLQRYHMYVSISINHSINQYVSVQVKFPQERHAT